MSLDLTKWGVIGPKDDSGLGRMISMLMPVMGIKRLIAIPSDRLPDIDLIPPFETRLPNGASTSELERELEGLQGLFFFERCEWHPELVPTAKRMGIKTVCVPMWEWFAGYKKDWKDVDLIACPTDFTIAVVNSYGFMQTTHLTWPVDVESLPQRSVAGPARLFVHSAGIVDAQDRKGTADTIRAFRRVKNPDIRLIVRMQKDAKMPEIDDRIEIRIGNIPDYTELYREGDTAIQPSKMEGLGFNVLEPFCCGFPTITMDYSPMNEFITDPRLLVKPRWGKRKAFPTAWIPHAHLRIPQTGDLARKIQWCAENDLSEISRQNRQIALERYDRDRIRDEWCRALDSIL